MRTFFFGLRDEMTIETSESDCVGASCPPCVSPNGLCKFRFSFPSYREKVRLSIVHGHTYERGMYCICTVVGGTMYSIYSIVVQYIRAIYLGATREPRHHMSYMTSSLILFIRHPIPDTLH